MLIACAGHTRTQAPQPVHACESMSGVPTPRGRKEMRTALGSQGSIQPRHSTPMKAMHAWVSRTALSVQGACPSSLRKACGLQASTQSPQNKHSSRVKSISGKPPRPVWITWDGQTSVHWPQRSHCVINTFSSSAQGGRTGDFFPETSPRRNCILLIDMTIYAHSLIYSTHCADIGSA